MAVGEGDDRRAATLRDVVICAPLRTPVGRMGGALAPLSALQLATLIVQAVV